MRKIQIKRKWKFASATIPFWIIPSYITKAEFMKRYDLDGDLCKYGIWGESERRLDVMTLDDIGVRVASGKTIELDINEGIKSLFVSTAWGSISNEISVQDIKGNRLCITTKGGLTTVSYPYIFEIV